MIKLGSVSFLNAKPLTFALENNLIENDFEIVATPPSLLSEMALRKEIDLGLIPVAELLQRKNYSLVPNISISSYGEVDSVILLLNKDMRDIKTVAVDRRSQSSTALLRIVLELFYELSSPKYLARDVTKGFLDGVDGGMIIGNEGLKKRYDSPCGYKVIDLGQAWTSNTGLPFVYAAFAVNEGVELGKNLKALQEAKEYGIDRIREIAKLESVKIGMDEETCFNYLNDRIRYDLGEKEKQGMITYSKYLEQLGTCESIDQVKTYP